ncbi:hypothetical protein FEM03_08050 [Phragmitibacter flavus]|uniref:Uncharacterized protein n=1 Tax=Phragmitibacter flavus TaxID=2576071 RepID=A0A5R8KGN3_9BACT|nr:hypothetical protein [Phragmitibacter flavus]TLD71468.1 hypothetical protein FEM03_08050 [Phragmitibacter flavus]
MADKIDDILKQRQAAPVPAESEDDKFFSILVGEGNQEHFLELRFQNGLQTCFSYDGLIWFNHDPETGCIDLEFGGFLVTIKGRGLRPIFNGVKGKRVAWVKEADSEMQDHKGNDCYVEAITITPPNDFSEEEPAAQK